MQKTLIGLLALLVLATVVGAATHWIVGGVAVVVLPVTVTYVRLKLSPAYRATTDEVMKTALND